MDATPKLTRWLAEHAGLQDAELGDRLGGGNSNVTQLIRHRDGLAVLRRPPDNAISASAASGVRREYRMLAALHGHAPVPRPLGFCEDPEVLGVPFGVAEHVDGVAISTALPPAYPPSAATLQSIGEELIDALATLHTLDWRALGIEPPDAPHDYVAKQIKRWLKARAEGAVRDLPLIGEIGSWLQARLPTPPSPCVMHGDFHLDNTLFRRDIPQLAVVIDWELASIGNPYADLALMLSFWGPRVVEPPGFAFVQKVSRDVGNCIDRDALARRWSRRTGLALDDFEFYRVFALWRLAAIVEGAYVLFRHGKVADDYSRRLEHDVPALLEEAARGASLRTGT
jgi:aminoglycoside phosphotransferase (APT) family kinase protein